MPIFPFLKSRKPDDGQSFFFIAHAKAGSTWIDDTLRTLFGKRVAQRFGADLSRFAYEPGRIYSAVFMTREEFLGYPGLAEVPRFIVIRDLRDTLVSRYFSMRNSHVLDSAGSVAAVRKTLLELPEPEGLAHVLKHNLTRTARIQRSWIGNGEFLFRYEDLFAAPGPLLVKILIESLALAITAEDLHAAIEANSFERKFGRKPGQVDAKSHGRTGAPGDWRNHFTRALAAEFLGTFGDILVATGYERDDAWAGNLPETPRT